MKITKIAHSCLLIEIEGVQIVTDPGNFSMEQNSLTNISAVLITHNHGDHFDINSVKEIIKNNPNAVIVTNTSVAELLQKEGIRSEIVEEGRSATVEGITFEGFGKNHAEIYPSMPITQNTGYLINGNIFFAGDAFTLPSKEIQILAVVAEAPWMKVSEVVDYVKKINPKICFPVHEGVLSDAGFGIANRILGTLLPQVGIEYRSLSKGESIIL